MKQRTLCFITILAAASGLYAQEASKQWSLQDCINYALEKNIKLQQDKIALEESDVDVKTAKASLFPSLSFNTGHNVINRPYQQNSSTVSGTEIISSDNKTTYNSVEWRQTTEQYQAAENGKRHCFAQRFGNREHAARGNHKTVCADIICR